MTVVTSYSKAGKHTYKIDSISFDKSPMDEFQLKDNTMISYADYYKK